jgi:cyanophycin synthetase
MIAKKKHITKAVLVDQQVPTANYVSIKTAQDLDKLAHLTFPLVVKPTHGKRGNQVVVGVTSRAAVARIYQQFVPRIDVEEGIFLLAEEMLSGHEYRILCVDHTFVAAAYRKPAHVVGDGRSSIQDLITAKNAQRGPDQAQPLTKLTIDATAHDFLYVQGYTLTSVPARGVEVRLQQMANLSTGGEPWNVTDQVCEENIALFEHIARVCDLNTVGIDVMCTSLSTPIREQPQAGVIEINASPGLITHHFPVRGEPINAAGKIIDMVLTRLHLV